MTVQVLASHKFLAILALFFATFVHEDFAIVGGSYLVSKDQYSLLVVLAATFSGVIVGDLGIYGLGRLCARSERLRAWAERRFPDGRPTWLGKNLAMTVIGCRFIPVALFPTFASCGLLGVPFRRFAALTALSAAIYVPLIFTISTLLGRGIAETVGAWSWLVVVVAAVAFVVAKRSLPDAFAGLVTRRPSRRRGLLRVHNGMPPLPASKVRVALQERFSEKIYYIPIVVHWLSMAVRFRSLTLPSIANPHIEAGGLLGESKIACLSMVPPTMRRWIAATTSVDIRQAGEDVEDTLRRTLLSAGGAGLDFPMIVKPDVGWRGFGVRKVRNEDELRRYLSASPAGTRIVLQEYVPHDGEAGVFYVRRPGEEQGSIFSLTFRYFPFVVGDGASTLKELIRKDPRSRWKSAHHFATNAHRLSDVPAPGEIVRLGVVGSNRVGGLYVDGRAAITEAMRRRFDEISRAIPEFYFGRYDIRFDTIEALQAGEDFSIVEINGAGAEAIHVWDPDFSMLAGYSTLMRQQRLLFEIAADNRARGFEPLTLRELIGYQRLQNRVTRNVPSSA